MYYTNSTVKCEVGIVTKSWSLLLAKSYTAKNHKPNYAANDSCEDELVLFYIPLWNISENIFKTPVIQMRTRPLEARVLTATFPQRGVVGLHMEPNGSYSVMSEVPTDHCCAAVAVGHTGNFWATRTQNSNCQQIKTQAEKSPQMFPGNRNISKWLKLQCWGNSFAGGFFHMKQWFRCLCSDQ